MRFVLVAAILLLAGAAGRAEALTIRDVIELTRAGVAEDVLLALIEVDGGVYATDTATLKALKEAGVSERVMVALVRSGRERRLPDPVAVQEPEPTPAPAPQVVVIDHHPPQVEQVVVPVPVYIPVYATRARIHRGELSTRQAPVDTYVPFQSGRPAIRHEPQPQPPVYWGFGGKLRPDAWGQPAADRKSDTRKSDTGQGRK
jgi:hypothetical protein